MNDNIHVRKHYLPRSSQFQPTVDRIREFFAVNARVVQSEFVFDRSGFDFADWRCRNVHGASSFMIVSFFYETEKPTLQVKGIQSDSDLPEKLFGTLRDFLVAGTDPQIVGLLNEPGETSAHKYHQPEEAKISMVRIDWGNMDISRLRYVQSANLSDGRGGYKTRVRPANERMYIFNTAFMCPPDSTHDKLKETINGFMETNVSLFRWTYDAEISDDANSGWEIHERQGESTRICVELFRCNEFWMVEVHRLSGNRELFYAIYDTLRLFLQRKSDNPIVDYSYDPKHPLSFNSRKFSAEPVYTEEEKVLKSRILDYMCQKHREIKERVETPSPEEYRELAKEPPACWFWVLWYCFGGWLGNCIGAENDSDTPIPVGNA